MVDILGDSRSMRKVAFANDVVNMGPNNVTAEVPLHRQPTVTPAPCGKALARIKSNRTRRFRSGSPKYTPNTIGRRCTRHVLNTVYIPPGLMVYYHKLADS